jgi:nitroreductase
MTFEDYFGFAGQDDIGKALRFLLGLAPCRLHAGYLVHPDAIDLANRKGPSTPMAIDMCAGMMATQVMKLLVGRGEILAAPIGLQFDPFVNRSVKFRNYIGYRNPLQRLAYKIGRREIELRLDLENAQAEADQPTPTMKVLELARWAPSGDNQQPWRFIVDAPDGFKATAVFVPDFFDYKGRGTLVSFGALIESIDLAAKELGYEANIAVKANSTPLSAEATVRLEPLAEPAPGLGAFLTKRSVYRYAMRPADLNDNLKAALAASISPDYDIRWIEDGANRRQLAAAIWKAADVRYRSPEAHKVHIEIIDWDKRVSEDRIPGAASGMNGPMRAMVRRTLPNWRLLDFMNRYAGGTLTVRLATEYLPFLRSNGAAVLLAPAPLKDPDDFIDLGRRVQRFWLTATELGLALQPAYVPLLLRDHVTDGFRHTDDDDLWQRTERAAEAFDRTFGADATRVGFLFRVGAEPGNRTARSVRRPLAELLAPSPATSAQ